MIRKFNTRLLFTDTNSLCYEIHGKKATQKMYKYKELFDLSNFPVSSKCYCSDNKKVVGKMKDEYGGKLIVKFVGLKSKMYLILDESSKEKSTNKGQKACCIELQEFHDTLFKKKILRHTMKGIKSKNHNLGTYETNKTLSCFDDKRYILRNGIETLTYGHKDI